MNSSEPIETHSPGRRTERFAALAAFAILAGAGVYQHQQLKSLRAELSEVRGALEENFSTLRETAELQKGQAQRQLETLRVELADAQARAAGAAGQARTEAQKHADRLAQELAAKQAAYERQVAGEFSAVKQSAEHTVARIDSVDKDVDQVESEVKLARADLDKTIAGLGRVNGDMGVMSGLIATNAQELSALRELGERNYLEFDLTKSKTYQRVGDVQLRLAKADPKRNRFTVEVFADDQRIEKKDKTLNEPIQFYTAGARQPYELVVNLVGRDRIKGYMATPKAADELSRNHVPKL